MSTNETTKPPHVGGSALNVELDAIQHKKQDELLESARKWREFATTASPEGLRRICVNTALSLESEANDGIAKCPCCMKPFSRGMWG